MYLIGLKIQNHKFDIAFSSDSEGFTWSGVDLVNVVVDLVKVVAFLQLLSMLLIFSFPQTVGDAPGSGVGTPRLGHTAQNQVKLKLVNSKSSF